MVRPKKQNDGFEEYFASRFPDVNGEYYSVGALRILLHDAFLAGSSWASLKRFKKVKQ